jgi:protocatechuate 3,4-dioxygenase beta subunit
VHRAGEPGAPLVVSGVVKGSDGKPIGGASIYVYQTDANGQYIPGGRGAAGSDRPRLFAYLRSDPEGHYTFSTIKPGSYPDTRNPAHIHFEVSAGGYQERVYEIVFAGDPFIDDRFRRQASEPYGGVVIEALRPVSGGGFEVTHRIELKKE